MDKQWTLEKLEKLIGKDQVERLFLEHYLNLIGRTNKLLTLVMV